MVKHATHHDVYDAPDRKVRVYERLGFTEAEFLRALPPAVICAFFGAAGSTLSVTRLGYLRGLWVPVFIIAVTVVGFVGGLLFISRLVGGSARGIASAVMPSGSTTPAVEDFSREDALLMQRDVQGALERFEQRIAADPLAVAARLRAAELYAAGGKDPRRAEALFRQVQRIPDVSPRDDVYASNRLVDLYDGVLDEPGRAVVELRRLVDRFPGTRAADEARRGLTTLKARLHAGREDA